MLGRVRLLRGVKGMLRILLYHLAGSFTGLYSLESQDKELEAAAHSNVSNVHMVRCAALLVPLSVPVRCMK